MKISALQKARYEYSPKLPGMLRNGIADICVKEGAETQSVADQEKIKALFPNTCANWGGAVFELHRILYGNNGYSWFAFHSRNPGNVQIINGYYNGTLVGTDVVMS